MARRKPITLGSNIDKNMELCRTTSVRVCRQTLELLIDEQIPFTQNWIRIPFLKREAYHGAKEVCIISTHCNEHYRARCVLDRMELFCRERIMLHAV